MVEAIIFAVPLIFIGSGRFWVSRLQETEADYIGMILMADAGFDPAAAVSVWKKMKEMEDCDKRADPRLEQTPQLISTHPHVRLNPI